MRTTPLTCLSTARVGASSSKQKRAPKKDYRRGSQNDRYRRRKQSNEKASVVVKPLLERLEQEANLVSGAEVANVVQLVKNKPGGAAAIWELYSTAIREEVSLGPQVYGIAISAIGRGKGWDSFKRANAIFDEYTSSGGELDRYIVSAMITACATASEGEQAFEIWETARQQGIDMDIVILNALLNVCARTRQADRALALYEGGLAKGLTPDQVTLGTLLNALAKDGRAEEAHSLYLAGKGIGLRPNVYILGTLISAFATVGEPGRALEVYEEGQSCGVKPDEFMVNALINAFGRAGDADSAWKLYTEGCEAGLPLATNEVTVSALLCAFAHTRDVPRALSFFEEVSKQWPQGRPPPVCYLLLRDVAAQAGDVAAGQKVSEMMKLMRGAPGSSHADLAEPAAPGKGTDTTSAAPRRRGVRAFATFGCHGKVYRTENGDAEELLPESSAEHGLLAGAAQELVDDLLVGTAYTFHTNSVLMMRGDEAMKAAVLTGHAEKKALGALIRVNEKGTPLHGPPVCRP
ncbi:hypothetical protein CYMTET_16562 [Cymbomonas tetramitiformis]|uniref:PROP1-like PPR domain-containing protein n=1 Tax=Cymbomonas tetramitiformis TaxID=36881 RepID=A0AAE0L851_9CHLO|nr:hypothetical protein CYMTET_16562 [Cymbomonas tetramitiformis]